MVFQNTNKNSARIFSTLLFIALFAGMAMAAPVVTSVYSATANGSYNASKTVDIVVAFNQSVHVTGVAYPVLNTTPNQNATRSDTSSNLTLIFTYTVQAGDTAARLDYLSNTSLYGTITASNNEETAIKTLAAPGTANSLGITSNITIDTLLPTAGTIVYANGYYTNASVTIYYTNGSDAGSGLNLSSAKIQRASATLSAGTCGSYGAFSDLASVSTVNTNYNDTTVSSGNCYIYQYLISDNAGNARNVSSANVTMIDTTPPVIGPVVISPQYGSSPLYISGTSTITASMSDPESGIAWCNYTINNTVWAAGTIAGANCTTISGVNTAAANSTNVRATNNAGAVGNGTAIAVTPDTTAPTINLMSPANRTNTTNSSATFVFNATDILPLNCSLYIDGAFVAENTSVTNNTATSWATSVAANANHSWVVRCSDALGNTGSSATSYITVDTLAPTVTLNAPAVYLNTSIKNVVFSDLLLPYGTITCNLTIDGAVNRSDLSVANNTAYNTTATSNFSDGNHNWSVTCWDGLNNTNTPVTQVFTVDTVAPEVTPVSPAVAANLTTANVSFVFNATDALATTMSCNLSIKGIVNKTVSATNGANTVYATSNFSDGGYNWTVSCWDNALNINSSMAARNFTVDTTAPAVYLMSPVNMANTTNSSITFQFNASELRAFNCSLYIDGAYNQTNSSVTTATVTSWTAPVAANATHSWYVLCSDDLGNTNHSEIRTLTVDQAAPTITLNAPAAYLNTSTMNITFNWTATDSLLPYGILTCNLTIGGAVNQSELSVSNGTWYNITATANFSDGHYNWSVACWDGLNNTGTSATKFFTVDTAAPTLVSNYSNTTFASANIIFNVNVSDGMSDVDASTVKYCRNVSGVCVASAGTLYPSLAPLIVSDGNWTYNFTATDNAGNMNTTLVYVYVDTSSPNITDRTPADLAVRSAVTNVSATITDAGAGLKNATLIVDGGATYISIKDYAAGTTTAIIYNDSMTLSTGVHNASLTVYNNATGSSPTISSWTFTVNTSLISVGSSLVVNWTLISFNVTPQNASVVSVFAPVASNITAVWGYSAGAWYKYVPGVGGDLTSITDGKAYFVNATAASSFTVAGAQRARILDGINPPIMPFYVSVSNGWNLVGVYANSTSSLSLNDVSQHPGGLFYMWNATSQSYSTSLSGSTVISSGQGFWMYTTDTNPYYPLT
ncbi:MAG: hypothetical protein NT051_05900 [Candidatus Micrarchaeota archaeon]|nr:hypothetical protein [Candidatus Micrarchaeota archaeon]